MALEIKCLIPDKIQKIKPIIKINSNQEQMKNRKNLILLSVLVVFMVSCLAPKNKEEYIKRFEKFVLRIEKDHKKYNNKDWKWADAQFEKFNKNYYLQFKGEYTLEDQIKIKTLILKYNSFKNNQDFGKIIQQLFHDDVDKIKGKVEDYVEKDMDKDLDELIKGAAVIGDSAIKVLEDVIEKIDNTF